MSATAETASAPERSADRPRWLLGAIVALLVTGGAFLVMWRVGTGGLLRPPPAPVQSLAFERVTFEPGRIEAVVRNSGPDPIQVEQVLIDEAYWLYTLEPDGRLDRLERATLRVDYPWVPGEPVAITVLDSAGVTFSHEVPVAAETPEAGGRTVLGYVVLGTYAGLIPVLLGLLFLPALRRFGAGGLRFLLGVTAGMLAFLAVDALSETLELGTETAAPFQAPAVIAGGIGLSLGALVLLGRRLGGARGSASAPLALAYLIAIGIGLHNFGEGLAIGSAHAIGAVALGTFLVIGFAVHNLTEGIGIVAPTIRRPPNVGHLLALGAIAGLPTIAGTLIGGFAYSPIVAIFLLALGIGAILQVVYELGRLVRREASLASAPWLAGVLAGFAVMYATGLLVA